MSNLWRVIMIRYIQQLSRHVLKMNNLILILYFSDQDLLYRPYSIISSIIWNYLCARILSYYCHGQAWSSIGQTCQVGPTFFFFFFFFFFFLNAIFCRQTAPQRGSYYYQDHLSVCNRIILWKESVLGTLGYIT
jgi:hypothetical protein